MKARKLTQTFLIAAAISAILVMTSHFAAQNVSESELRYREALRKQQVDGDLPVAIKLYQGIVGSKTADRTVKAKALLQLAVCYETLGKESQTVYQQIVRDFADQPAAAQAKAKLAVLRAPAPPPTMTMRKIEFGPGIDTRRVLVTDGERVFYVDADGTVFLGDVAGKNKNKVFSIAPNRWPRGWTSRDFSINFLSFTQSQEAPAAYAILKTDGTGLRNIDLSINGSKLEASGVPVCLSWFPDNRYILMCRRGPTGDRLRLFKVSIADGQSVDVLPEWTKPIIDGAVSPDGRYIAFSDSSRGVYLMPAKGGNPRIVAEDARLAGWTDDGKYFLFLATTNNVASLFALPMKDGQPAGERIFIRTLEAGTVPVVFGSSMVLAPTGFSPRRLFFASLNGDGYLSSWKELEVEGTDISFPAWSPDSSRFVYVAVTPSGPGRSVSNPSAVRLYTVATGEDRELFRSKNRLRNCVWAARQPAIFCVQLSVSGTDVLRISTETGRAENLRSFEGERLLGGISADDRVLSMTNFRAGTFPQWEIGSDHETSGPNPLISSPDGRWLLRSGRDAANRYEYQIRPSEGNENDWKHLAYLNRQAARTPQLVPSRFSPDSNWIIYHDKDADGRDGLYRVSTSGGEPQRLGDYPTAVPDSWLAISKDGHILVNTVPEIPVVTPEFWLLENFIPKVPQPQGRTKP